MATNRIRKRPTIFYFVCISFTNKRFKKQIINASHKIWRPSPVRETDIVSVRALQRRAVSLTVGPVLFGWKLPLRGWVWPPATKNGDGLEVILLNSNPGAETDIIGERLSWPCVGPSGQLKWWSDATTTTQFDPFEPKSGKSLTTQLVT